MIVPSLHATFLWKGPTYQSGPQKFHASLPVQSIINFIPKNSHVHYF